MAYINQVQVGSTTYDIRDKRLENPVDFAGVITQATTSVTAMTLTVGAEETDQWKVGSTVDPAWILETEQGTNTREIKFTASSPGMGYKRLYPGDLVYGYHGATATSYYVWAAVPSADNPHTHSIPALSGTALSVNSHSHTYSVPTQADSSGAHSHEFALPKLTGSVAVSKNTQSTGGATSTFTGTAANTDSQGGHSHTFTGTESNTGNGGAQTVTSAAAGGHSHTFTGTAVNSTSDGGHSHTITVTNNKTWIPSYSNNTLVFTEQTISATSTAAGSHSHSVTASGTIGTVGDHSHSVTVAAHSHSFTPAGTLSSDGSHSHSVTAKGSVSTTITWPQYVGTATIQAVSGLTTEGVPDHTHGLSGSSAKNTGKAGGHGHDVSTDASRTGSGQ